MKIHIKYMVSNRCKVVVQATLELLELPYNGVEIGEVEVRGLITNDQRNLLKIALRKAGIEIMDDKKAE